MQIKVEKLSRSATIPCRASDYAAGYDLYADEPSLVTIPAGQTVQIHTNIAIEIPDGYFGAIFARSGIATRNGIRPANCVGVIDSDYRGEIIVALHNDSTSNHYVDLKDRVAQLVILPYVTAEFEEASSLSATTRGAGGFGSTGVN